MLVVGQVNRHALAHAAASAGNAINEVADEVLGRAAELG